MAKPSYLAFVFLLLGSNIRAQELNVDMTAYCHDQDAIHQSLIQPNHCETPNKPGPLSTLVDQFKLKTSSLGASPSVEEQKKRTCQSIMGLAKLNANPVEIKLNDDQGNPWKVRLHFGFTRTDIRPTDVRIKSTLVNTTIKGFEFSERTSAEHYDPRTWQHLQDAARWIDEPSNTFTVSIENKNNAFYITAFHPKFLKTHYELKQPDGNGGEVTTYTPATEHLSNGTAYSFESIPKGQSGVEIQNTHLLMNYQIGYGRKFTLFDDPKAGKLSYIARADAGITMGGARSIYINEDRNWIENRDKLGVQGVNASIGQRLEYQRGKVALFLDQKYTTSQIDHGFLDGTASYKLDYSTVTFGVAVDVFRSKKNQKKKDDNSSGK